MLVAVASLRAAAARAHPEAFGAINDFDAAERKRARFDHLCSQIGSRWQEAELTYGDIDETSRALVTIEGVPIFPAATLGGEVVPLNRGRAIRRRRRDSSSRVPGRGPPYPQACEFRLVAACCRICALDLEE